MRNQGVIGSVVMAAGGFCPLLRVPVLGNWNYFDVDQRLAVIFYILVLLGLVAAFTQKAGLLKFVGWATIVLVLLTLVGIYFKVHDSFNFIHFKKIINLAAGLVKYKWGWFVILTGALFLVTVRRPAHAIV
ncbi:hypothetical protein AAKU52_001724 [Pedobacter sp. CG_S7]|uniref:hypothetical protein n=1 Tax=Pedobacter sp. CG_S7 TaxID=3143930 RepID=UPI00339539F1